MHRTFATWIFFAVLIVGHLGCGDDPASASDAGTDASSGTDKHAAGHGSVAANGGTGAGHAQTMAGAGGVASDAGTDAGTPALTLRFKAQVADKAFACGVVYDQLGTTKLSAKPRDFRFFVQDIKLIAHDGNEVPFEIEARAPFQLPEVAMIDFNDGTGGCSGDTQTHTEIVGSAAAGDYDGIVFSIGVPESINHQNIALAKAPLQDASLYWGWQNGYRFLLAELSPEDILADDAGTDDAGVAIGSSLIHIGSGGCAGSNTKGFTCSRPNRNRVRIMGFDPRKRAVVADLAKIFEHVDLSLGTQCHGAGPGCEPIFAALGVDMTTGATLPTQSVFRAE